MGSPKVSLPTLMTLYLVLIRWYCVYVVSKLHSFLRQCFAQSPFDIIWLAADFQPLFSCEYVPSIYVNWRYRSCKRLYQKWMNFRSIWSISWGTVCWIGVKVSVLCARQYMSWNIFLIKVLNNFWYFEHPILTMTYLEVYLKHNWRNCLWKK